jgi:hypothetical protein
VGVHSTSSVGDVAPTYSHSDVLSFPFTR